MIQEMSNTFYIPSLRLPYFRYNLDLQRKNLLIYSLSLYVNTISISIYERGYFSVWLSLNAISTQTPSD